MWIFLSNAFLSIVDKGDPTGETLLVRARKHGDIERVFPEAQVIEGAGTDYRYRARIPRDQAANAIAEAVRNIKYGNFKDQVKEASRHDAYLDVWGAMAQLQRKRGRRSLQGHNETLPPSGSRASAGSGAILLATRQQDRTMAPIPDSNGMFFQGLGLDEKPYLGSPSVVEHILRAALNGLVALRTRQIHGEAVDIVGEVSSIALSLQDVFYGGDPRFRHFPWLSVRHLGKALVEQSGVGGDPGDALERVMLKMCMEFMQAYIDFESNEDGGDEEFRAETDRLVAFYITTVLGIRPAGSGQQA